MDGGHVIDSGTGPDAEGRLAHLHENELAAYLDGGLAARERGRVEAHIDVCDACRAELVAIGRAIGRRGARGRAAVLWSRRWWIPAVAAAGITAILLVPRELPNPRTTTDATPAQRVVDGEGQRHIALVSPPDDATVPAAQIAFAWHATPADVYRIYLLTQSGDSIWATETTDTTVVVPSTVDVRPGSAYFWRVDAVANGIVATTGVHRIHVER